MRAPILWMPRQFNLRSAGKNTSTSDALILEERRARSLGTLSNAQQTHRAVTLGSVGIALTLDPREDPVRGRWHDTGTSAEHVGAALRSGGQGKTKESLMFIVLALILAIAWISGFAVMHVSSMAIHLLLLFALVSVVMHVVRGRRVT